MEFLERRETSMITLINALSIYIHEGKRKKWFPAGIFLGVSATRAETVISLSLPPFLSLDTTELFIAYFITNLHS